MKELLTSRVSSGLQGFLPPGKEIILYISLKSDVPDTRGESCGNCGRIMSLFMVLSLRIAKTSIPELDMNTSVQDTLKTVTFNSSAWHLE